MARVQIWLAATGIALSGCYPQFTRVPDLIPRSVAQDKADWNLHDPQPDHTQGPSTDHRFAGCQNQRTLTRSALEKNAAILEIRTPADGPRPQARLNPKTANVVEP